MPKRAPNEDKPATAISFSKETLDLLRDIAKSEERSLAAQVRVAVESWLRSSEGVAAARKSKQKALDLGDLSGLSQAPPSHEDKDRVFSELRELLAKYSEKKDPQT